MFDIHCHLLPGIDDGPGDIEQSLAMSRLAVSNGITHAVVTPHITPGRYDNTLDSITACYENFRRALDENRIPLKTGMAAEVRIDPLIMEMVNQQTLPILGRHQDNYVFLLEFPHDVIPQGSLKMIDWLSRHNLKPVIAHPERNKAIINNSTILDPFLEKGCLLQITSGSLSGIFGKSPQKCAASLLKDDKVFAIASDAHNLLKRVPDMEQGRLTAEKIVGKEKSYQLVLDNPGSLLAELFEDE